MINVGCAHKNTDWVLVPGRAVTRLLLLDDPYRALPIAGNVEAAVSSLQDSIRRPLQLVSKSR
jgi:hypothetical protein